MPRAINGTQRSLTNSRHTPLTSATLMVIAALVCGDAAAQEVGGRHQSKPLVLQSEGSFFVGGRNELSDALNSKAPSSGTVTVDQMYVQYQIPVSKPGAQNLPVIMIHGCCLSAKSFEETPDGRMGWNEYFVRRGHPTYLPEQASRARSGFDATILNEIALGLDGKTASDIPYIYSIGHEGAYVAFRFGPKVNHPYANEQFPVEAVDEFYKQLIPDLNGFLGNSYPPTPNPTYRDLSKLAIQVGGAVIIGHSESGFFPENAALVNTDHIAGMVSIEPGGSCTTTNPGSTPLTPKQIKILATIPTLVLFGDHVKNSGFEGAYESCRAYTKLITDAGGDIVFIHLPDIGIHGNSHMMMLDKNNLEVADVILDWMRDHVAKHQN